MLMMVPHVRLFAWIGLVRALVGMWLLIDPADGNPLPINQVLSVLDCILVVIWGVVSLTRGRGSGL